MSGVRTSSLPPFLHLLSCFPDPLIVAEALARGPLAGLGGRTCVVMSCHDDLELRTVSGFGYSERADDRYRTLSLKARAPIVRAYAEARVVVTSTQDFVEEVADPTQDRDLWDQLTSVLGPGDVVDAPIISQGMAIGAFGFISTGHGEWRARDFALIEGVGATLGLWMTHPRSGVQRLMRARPPRVDDGLRLTDRQVQVLQLVEAGKSNAAIAAALGYSESTVKQEVLRILRMLRATDRHEAVRRAREIGLLS